MTQIQPKFIGGAEAHFVSAELNENVLSYKLYDAEQNEFAGGSLATDGTITEETALDNVLSSLGVKSLAQIEAEEQARIEAERQAEEAEGQTE